MKTYYKSYFNIHLDGREETPAFIILAQEEEYGIAFPETMDEESIEIMSMAIGTRIAVAKKEGTLTPGEILNSIPYNMMFIQTSEEDIIYPTWEEASDEAKNFLEAFSHKSSGWKFKLHSPMSSDSSDNDNKTEEK
jgi:hypothetical protein